MQINISNQHIGAGSNMQTLIILLKNILKMIGTRIKIANEQLPSIEVEGLFPEIKYQVRYDFSEFQNEEVTHLRYHYVNVHSNDRDAIISAIIRERYGPDKVAAILRKKAIGEGVIEFVKFNHFVAYAKTAASGQPLAAIKTSKVYEVVIPLNLTLSNSDYADLADQCIKTNIPFEVDVANNLSKAYPSWLRTEDQAALEADGRVTVNEISLFE